MNRDYVDEQEAPNDTGHIALIHAPFSDEPAKQIILGDASEHSNPSEREGGYSLVATRKSGGQLR